MFTSQDFVEGQNYDLKDVLIETGKKNTPFTTFLMSKSVKATSPQVHWITEEINESSAVTMAEGGDAPAFVKDTQTLHDNYLELFGATATVSNTAQASNAVGINDLLAHEVSKKTKAIKRRIENKMIFGTKAYDGATGTYTTGGILEQIDPANKITGTSLTEAKFDSMLKPLYDAGASEDMVVFTPASMKKTINGFKTVEHFASEKFLGFDIEQYVSVYGVVTFVLCEALGNNNMFVINRDYIETPILIPFNGTVQSVSGSKRSIYLETQMGLKLLNPQAAASFEITA